MTRKDKVIKKYLIIDELLRRLDIEEQIYKEDLKIMTKERLIEELEKISTPPVESEGSNE